MSKSKSKSKKPRLGRGLSSLVSMDPVPVAVEPEPSPQPAPDAPTGGGAAAPAESIQTPAAEPLAGELVYLGVDQLAPNPHQPREHFDERALASLAESIRQDGLMQPVVVRPTNQPGRYELVAGERRWRAAGLAELGKVPAIIRELSDRQMAEWALIENLQREDLDPIERAVAFRGLVDQFALSHDQVAGRVGVERSTVTNYLRLLELSESIQQAVRQNLLSGGHARALLGITDLEAREAVAQKAIAGGWSVRALESAVRKLNADTSPQGPKRPNRAAHLSDLEKQIAAQLQTKVHLKSGRRKGSGTLAIEFYSLDQFDELLQKLGVSID